jgi:hypothetical protein
MERLALGLVTLLVGFVEATAYIGLWGLLPSPEVMTLPAAS